jgi:hypothetical protein
VCEQKIPLIKDVFGDDSWQRDKIFGDTESGDQEVPKENNDHHGYNWISPAWHLFPLSSPLSGLN